LCVHVRACVRVCVCVCCGVSRAIQPHLGGVGIS
jgi:hypothetical protein